MKKHLLLFILCPFLINAQTTRVTVSDGDFLNPFVWNPAGIPTNGDQLTINHNLTLSNDIYYTVGQINISASGSLMEDATDRNIWINGGSLTNAGTLKSHLVWVSNFGFLNNSGYMIMIDSLLVQADFINSGNAGINDLWIAQGGILNNSGNMTNTDSMFVQGIFTNSGIAGAYDLAVDEMGSLDNSSILVVTHNMHNQGLMTNSYSIEVGLDFSNCNTQSMNGTVINDGIWCIANDFLNCGGDSILGSGDYYIGGLSSNLGVFDGSHFFHTPSGSLTLNTGTVSPTVTLTTGSCIAGIVDNDIEEIEVYPNPTHGDVKVSKNDVQYQIVGISGNVVAKGTVSNNLIETNRLNTGIYLLQIDGQISRLIKL